MTDVTLKVNVDAHEIDDAVDKVKDLCSAVEKAKSLVGDLAKMMESMSVKSDV